MFHYVYKVTADSGKYYIGRHSTKNMDDGYLGSGKWARNCRKSGVSLTKEILTFCSDFDTLLDKEEEYIAEHFSNPLNMNFHISACGFGVGSTNWRSTPEGRKYTSDNHWTKTEYGRKWVSVNNPSRRADVKKVRAERIREQWADPVNRAKWSGENHHMNKLEHKQRMVDSNPMHDPEARAKLSARFKGVPQKKVECPHCNKIGGISKMHQHHFENCKHKL